MPGFSYTVSVKSPCIGQQLVNKVATNYYAGSQGDFTYVTMGLAPGATKWKIYVTDYSGGACSPSIQYEQETGDASDPGGVYLKVGSGDGEAVVTPWP